MGGSRENAAQARPLAGRGIVVTRPQAQAVGLAARIERAGGTAFLYPAIEIAEVEDPRVLHGLIDDLERFDLAIFVSPTAVAQAVPAIRARRGARAWPARLRVASIGRGSRAALEAAGFENVISPATRADSEALLSQPELSDVRGRRVVVFRGEGGREALADALRARGAEVVYAECYRRRRPRFDGAPLLAAWRRGAIHAVTVSSGEGLANLADLLGAPGRQFLCSTPLFVPHDRVSRSAAQLGIREVRVAGPSDGEVVDALVAYFARAK